MATLWNREALQLWLSCCWDLKIICCAWQCMLCEGWTLELLWFRRNSLILKGCMLRTQTAAFPHLSCLLPRQIYSLWEYEFLSGPDPEKCISTGLFVVMENCCSPWDPSCESLLITSGAGTVKPNWHSSSCMLAPAHGGRSRITSKPHCSQVEHLQLVQGSWKHLQVCSLGLLGTQKTE